MLHFNEKSIFLLDGIGALVSIILLGVVLPAIQPWIGMPLAILYWLALVPVVFAIYSFCCFFGTAHQNRRWLKGIMLGNALYCAATTSLVIYFFTQMTWWGVSYFAIEFIVLVLLIWLEGKIAYSPIENTDTPP